MAFSAMIENESVKDLLKLGISKIFELLQDKNEVFLYLKGNPIVVVNFNLSISRVSY